MYCLQFGELLLGPSQRCGNCLNILRMLLHLPLEALVIRLHILQRGLGINQLILRLLQLRGQ